MCSKSTSSGSYGDESDDFYYSGLCPKKHKRNNTKEARRRRVPRRGPGVAELEKIRLEQQQHNNSSEITGSVYPYFQTGSLPNDLIPQAPVFQNSSLHYLPPMDLTKLEYRGFHQFMEPPLNQTSCLANVSQFLDDEKMVKSKRPWRQAVTIPRDGKQIKSLDHNNFQDLGTTIRNPITIDSSFPSEQTIPNSSLDFPRFRQKEKLDHQFAPRRGVANLSSNAKPLYSFLTVSEQSTHDKDLSLSLKTDRFDTVADHGIDLRLKL